MWNTSDNTSGSILVKNIGRLLTMSPRAGSHEIRSAAVLIKDGTIVYVGHEWDLDPTESCGADVLDAGGGLVSPGLVDCHTHLVFIGNRADEFEARGAGLSYEEIARRGGGIMRTVMATRSASEDQLFEIARDRVMRSLALGVTTLEIKSGYGLTLNDEMKLLRVVRRLAEETPADIVPTFLGAHAVPPDITEGREGLAESIVREWIPAVAEQGLARFCDVFCERFAFTLDESRRILQAGLDYGLLPKIHADQMSRMGGARLAADIGAVSADHLDFADRSDLRAMAAARVVGVLLPGCNISLGQTRFVEGARLLDTGAHVALATDYNPGSSVTQNLVFTGTLAMAYMGMTVYDTWAALTVHAAEAVGLAHKVGMVVPGHQGDLVVFHTDDPRVPFYEYAMSHVAWVVKKGKVVVQRSKDGEVHFMR